MHTEISNVDELHETNELQFAFRLHYHFFMISIHMQTSSAAKYALYMHLNSQKHFSRRRPTLYHPVKPVVPISEVVRYRR